MFSPKWTTWLTPAALRKTLQGDLDTIVGKAMHVLVGYTAQPSGIQMVFYAATVLLLLLGMRLARLPAPPVRRVSTVTSTATRLMLSSNGAA